VQKYNNGDKMEERLFLDRSSKPTEPTIQSSMGNAYIYYRKVLDIVTSYSQGWNFTKSSGWMLKVYDQKKALFYLIPLKDGLKISLTIRENERVAFLQDDELKIMHNAIASSRKYMEGFALQFNIEDEKGYDIIEFFLRKLIGIRT
jgi:hypothetical protein